MKKRITRIRRKKRLPIQAKCRNCGTDLVGPYCQNCGQYLFAGTGYSLDKLISRALYGVFSIDGKLFYSLKYLLFYPGKLSKDYVDGHIARYVSPSKLFWIVSVLFFALLSIQFDASDYGMKTNIVSKDTVDNLVDRKLTEEESGAKIDGVVVVNSASLDQKIDSVSAVNIASSDQKLDAKIDSVVNSRVGNTGQVKTASDEDDSQEWSKIKKAFTKDKLKQMIVYAPYIMFILIPLFTFLFYICFRKYRRYYGEHLIFALYYHTYTYVIMGLFILICLIFPNLSLPWSLTFWLPLIYLSIAVYVFYRPRIFPAILKLMFILFTHLIIVTFVASLALGLFIALTMAKDVIDV